MRPAISASLGFHACEHKTGSEIILCNLNK